MSYQLTDVSFGYTTEKVLDRVELNLPPGEMVGILGPNGSGKSTFLRLLSRFLEPTEGEILLGGEPLRSIPLKELAKRVAVVEQDPWIDPPFRVEEVVGVGRYPHRSGLRFENGEDRKRIDETIQLLHIDRLRNRRLTEISAGERQRVFLGKALVQETPILLLDEPVVHLDLHYQIETLKLLRELSQRRGLTLLLVLHDLLLASLFCDRVVLFHRGRLLSQGVPEEVLTEERVRQAFEIDAVIRLDSARRQVILSLLE